MITSELREAYRRNVKDIDAHNLRVAHNKGRFGQRAVAALRRAREEIKNSLWRDTPGLWAETGAAK